VAKKGSDEGQAPAASGLVGTKLDVYELVRLIGEGGMGEVYEASHTLIGRKCAIKVLHPTEEGAEALVRRMIREARAASSIGHPNIVEVYDFRQAPDGAYYMVMELLDGLPLSKIVTEGQRISQDAAVSVMWSMLSALKEAHGMGIIHRDLKPENVFIARAKKGGYEVKILDFGISKFVGGKDSMRLTHTGAVLGTPYYMSPEQASGAADVDTRSDLWACGVILYEMLTGQVPFLGNSYNAIIAAILLKDHPPAAEVCDGVPPELDHIIARALTKDPVKRYQNAREFLNDLKPFRPDGPVTVGQFSLARSAARIPDALVPPDSLDEPVPEVDALLDEPVPAKADSDRAPTGRWTGPGVSKNTGTFLGPRVTTGPTKKPEPSQRSAFATTEIGGTGETDARPAEPPAAEAPPADPPPPAAPAKPPPPAAPADPPPPAAPAPTAAPTEPAPPATSLEWPLGAEPSGEVPHVRTTVKVRRSNAWIYLLAGGGVIVLVAVLIILGRRPAADSGKSEDEKDPPRPMIHVAKAPADDGATTRAGTGPDAASPRPRTTMEPRPMVVRVERPPPRAPMDARDKFVTITLKRLPPRARVFVEGKRIRPPIRLQKRKKKYCLTILARGYWPFKKCFWATADRTITAKMYRRGRPGRRPPPGPRIPREYLDPR
jgi:serine/threonine-protein kinase